MTVRTTGCTRTEHPLPYLLFPLLDFWHFPLFDLFGLLLLRLFEGVVIREEAIQGRERHDVALAILILI